MSVTLAAYQDMLWIFCFSSRSVKCSSAGPFSRQRFSIISRFFLSINSGRGANFIGKFEVPMPEPTEEELAAEEKCRQIWRSRSRRKAGSAKL